MKIPSDDDIDEIAKNWYEEQRKEPCDRFYYEQGLYKMRDQLKPLLDLIKQLREARKEYDKTKYDLNDFSLKQANDLAGLQELRDKLELSND